MAQINPSAGLEGKIPNLFIIGVPKSGTTTLHGLLDQHPQVYMCSPKEPRFFSRDSEYIKGFNWYINSYFKDANNHRIRGEATPTYLYMYKKTIPRIKDCLSGQKAKFIAIFRNPIDRAYSHYWFNRNTKIKLREELSFEDALEAEDQRMKDHAEFYEQGTISYAYFQTGLYAKQTQAFVEGFGRENCLFLLFEDLFPGNFSSTVQTVEEFLSVEKMDLEYARKKESVRFRSKALTALIRKSRAVRAVIARYIPSRFRSGLKSAVIDFNTVPFKYPEMKPEIRKMLLEKYRHSIAQFEKIISRDLSHWQ